LIESRGYLFVVDEKTVYSNVCSWD